MPGPNFVSGTSLFQLLATLIKMALSSPFDTVVRVVSLVWTIASYLVGRGDTTYLKALNLG